MEYVPSRRGWETIAPAEAGFDAGRLEEAVRFAVENESRWPTSMFLDDGRYIGTAYVEDRPPYDQVMGPVRPRGPANGLILRGGRIVAEWGDTAQVDMTFSVAKSYIAIVAGLAVDRGLIPDIDAPVREVAPDEGFESAHNAQITWRHLLQQTSEWEGVLFERPDSVDRNRQVGPEVVDNPNKGTARTLSTPGTHWEYNDVRVNRLALSLLRVFRRPLPEVLRELVMDPVGASDSWEWHGYDTSWVDIDGRRIQSVSGGGHWGGGFFISARDQARTGLMVQRNGLWGDRVILSEAWTRALRTPAPGRPGYGFLWWLNANGEMYPEGPRSSIFAAGGGSNTIWVDSDLDLTVVSRWMHKPAVGTFVGKVTAALLPG